MNTIAYTGTLTPAHLDRIHEHLPEGSEARKASATCALAAAKMIKNLPDSPELLAGLRKLLEAKDCFVRAAIAAAEGA